MKPDQRAAPASARQSTALTSTLAAAGAGAVVSAAEYLEYERELDRLRALRARSLPQRLREARGFVSADVAEEVAHIQEEHAVLDARIARLDELLRTATVVADGDGGDLATLGCTVEVEYERTGRRASYRLSGIASGGGTGCVSARSPVGRALMGRRAGDVVSVELPAGRVEPLRIVAIAPPLAEAS